jgi:hypothetical protein
LCNSFFSESIFPQDHEIVLEVEAWEPNPDSGWVSCPWIYCWNGSAYVADNDIYSTARGAGREYTDYYTIQKPLFEMDGVYAIELRENGAEYSYTDMVNLLVVDHSPNARIGTDEFGKVYSFTDPLPPINAIRNKEQDQSETIVKEDSIGIAVYHQDQVEVDFGEIDVIQKALLVLRAIGFKADQDQDWGEKTYQQPTFIIQTLDSTGVWASRNTFYPRDSWATGCYDLTGMQPDVDGHMKVRIFINSCHTKKYHIIDYIGLDTVPQESIQVNRIIPSTAVHSNGTDVLSELVDPDGIYVETRPG